MTTALYRRYRPDTFQDVIGQEHVTAPLMAALRADRVTHAYLFSGPRGCGKTTSARILARCLNCENYPTDTPCGQCPSCRDLATGGPGSLDVVEIDAASHNGVDDARDLRERAAFAPARDRFKIFILDEAHMVTPQGFNALLKLVEEPPAHVKFIFATTEPEKVIGTIRSRTHHYPFRLVPPDVLETYLAQLCQAEGVEVGPGVFPLVTRAGGGSVRDTLSVMDQLIGGQVDGTIDYQRAVALLGYTDATLLDECVDAIAAADGAGVFRVVDQVISSGHDPRRFVEDLLQRLRDLLVIALAGAEAGPALGSVPADQMARMEVQARTLGSGALSRFADLTAQALTGMVGATSPRLQLELLMARLLVPSGGQRPASPEVPTPQLASAPTVASPVGAGRAGAPGAHGQAGAGVTGGDPRALAAQIAQQASAAREGAADGQSAAGAGRTGGGIGRAGGAGSSSGVVPGQGWEAQPGAGGVSGAARPQAEPGAQVPAGTEPQRRAAEPGARPGAEPGVSQPAQGAAEAQMIRSRWGEVLDAAKRSRRATWALVEQHAQPGTLHDGVFQILFTAPGLVGAFENGGHGPVLAEAIHQALGLQVECHGVLAGGPGTGPGSAGPGTGGPGAGGPGSGGSGPVGSGGQGAGPGAYGTTGRAGAEPVGQAGASERSAAPGGGQSSQARGREQRPQASAGRSAPEAGGGESDEDPHAAGAGQSPALAGEPGGVTGAAREDAGEAGRAAGGGANHGEWSAGPSAADAPRGGIVRSQSTSVSEPVTPVSVPEPTGRVSAPEPAAPAEPAVVGWGEVAQVGRGRHHDGGGAADVPAGQTAPASAPSPAVAPASVPAPASASGSRDAAVPQDHAHPVPTRPSTQTEDTGLAQVTRLHPLPAVPASAGAPAGPAASALGHTGSLAVSPDGVTGMPGAASATGVAGTGGPAGLSDAPGTAGTEGAVDAEGAVGRDGHAAAPTAPTAPGGTGPVSTAVPAGADGNPVTQPQPAGSREVGPDTATTPTTTPAPVVPLRRPATASPGMPTGPGAPAGPGPLTGPGTPTGPDAPAGQAAPVTPADQAAPATPAVPAGPSLPPSALAHPRPGQATGRTEAAASSARTQSAAEATFSDGVPLPPEPGDADGPGGPDGGWTPPSESIARAMAVARAAAEGHAPAQEVGHAGPGRGVSLEDDVPSEDDEDAEEAGVVGLEVVKRILGATVLEDVIINPEDH